MGAYAQPSVVKKIIEIGKTDNRVMDHLDVLTNRFGGRLVGSDAYENAAEWMMHEYSKWGLDVRLEKAGEVPVGFNRGGWWGRMIGGDEPMTLHFVTPSYTSGTKGLQRGHVLLDPKNWKEFTRMKHALRGAWVLIDGTNSGWPAVNTRDEAAAELMKKIARENEMKNDSIRRDNRENNKKTPLEREITAPALYYKEMVEAGVLGFIQSAQVPLRALYDRRLVNDPNTTFENLPTVPEIKLDEHQFAKIKQMAKERREFWLEFDIRNYFKLGPVPYHNVVASIPGSKYPDEYVIVSGHLDAFDVASGAIDCGTGIGPMMEAARLLMEAGAKPKRTILFVAFAAEEFGLLGAQAFCRDHVKDLEKISYVFNRDGGPTPPVGISVPQAMYDDFVEICKPLETLNEEIPFKVKVASPRPAPYTIGGTDASVFDINGVPSTPFTEEDVKGYNFDYDEIWHTERDRYDHEIPEYQEHAAIVTAIVALGVANLDHLLSREGMYTVEN